MNDIWAEIFDLRFKSNIILGIKKCCMLCTSVYNTNNLIAKSIAYAKKNCRFKFVFKYFEDALLLYITTAIIQSQW